MTRPLRVFLCHASQDKPAVRELYTALKNEGWVDPWLDKAKILPGQDWEMVIEKAVEDSDVVIVCLSNQSVTKEGFVQREIRYAYDIALEKPEETIFLIPLRLDDCIVPRKLRMLHWVDFFEPHKENSYSDLRDALKLRYDQKLYSETKELERKQVEEQVKRESEELARKLVAEEVAREIAAKEVKANAERETAKKAAREKRERKVKEGAKLKAKEKVEREKKSALKIPKPEIKKPEEQVVPVEDGPKKEILAQNSSLSLGGERRDGKLIQKKPFTKLLDPSSLLPKKASYPQGGNLGDGKPSIDNPKSSLPNKRIYDSSVAIPQAIFNLFILDFCSTLITE